MLFLLFQIYGDLKLKKRDVPTQRGGRNSAEASSRAIVASEKTLELWRVNWGSGQKPLNLVNSN